MEITIKGTNFELTPAVKDYVQKKLAGLDKYHSGILRMDVELELTTRHHHKSDTLWRAEANVPAAGKLFRVEAEAGDVHEAIDQLKDEIKRELLKNKEKRLTARRDGAKER